MSKSILLPTIAAAALATAAAAAPQVGEIVVQGRAPAGVEVKSQLVDYRDIDARSPDGARVLFRRIRNAAEDACGPPATDLIKNLPEYDDARDNAICQVQSIRTAVAQVDSPTLNSYVDSLR